MATEIEAQERWNSGSILDEQCRIIVNLLKGVRTCTNEDIQTISQVFEYVLREPSKDKEIARIMQDSGYLDLWKVDLDKNPWYIDEDKMAEHCNNDMDSLDAIAKASVWLMTFYEELKSLFEKLNNIYQLKSLKQQVSLYDNLYKLSARRVACAGMVKQELKDGGTPKDQIDGNSLDIFFTEDISQIIP